jgi:hypothetical protein
MRGTSSSQVDGAEIVLVSSGPGILPTSSIILHN